MAARPGPDPVEPQDGPQDEPQGSVRPTGHRPLVAAGVVGLVVGWSLRLLALRTGRAQPDVTWTAIAVLVLAAAILGGTALLTRRAVRRDRAGLVHEHAVNRLVLAKACAIAAALLVGGYVGYGVAQLGVEGPAALTRLWRSALAALAALAMTAAALLLEHACRVPRGRS